MNQYVTGALLKRLRENKQMTQSELASKLSVSDKAVSKWETGKGFPDVSLIEPLSLTLGVSTTELLSGCQVSNNNLCAKVERLKIYVCPVCGNVIVSVGEAVVSCHGITLVPEECEQEDEQHAICVDKVEDEYYVTANHSMEKSHYVSFFVAVSDNGYELVKLYPEGSCEAVFKMRRTKFVYAYCNKHGLFKKVLK